MDERMAEIRKMAGPECVGYYTEDELAYALCDALREMDRIKALWDLDAEALRASDRQLALARAAAVHLLDERDEAQAEAKMSIELHAQAIRERDEATKRIKELETTLLDIYEEASRWEPEVQEIRHMIRLVIPTPAARS